MTPRTWAILVVCAATLVPRGDGLFPDGGRAGRARRARAPGRLDRPRGGRGRPRVVLRDTQRNRALMSSS